MITGFDRLMAAANGEKSDRIPVFCNLLDQGAKELGLSLKEYYSKGEYVAEGQLKMREKYGYDNLWSLFYVGKEAELLGCKNIIYANDGPPTIGHMVFRKPEDIHNMVIPDDISNHPEFQETLKCLQILKKESGDKYPICAYITASMAMPAMLMGMEKWMDMLLSGPFDLRDKLLAMRLPIFLKNNWRPIEKRVPISLFIPTHLVRPILFPPNCSMNFPCLGWRKIFKGWIGLGLFIIVGEQE